MSGNSKIVVDLGQLRETSKKIDDDTRAGLEPGISDADSKMQHGVRFGMRSPSGEIAAASIMFNDALRIHRANGAAHIRQATQLAVALTTILEKYSSTDSLSALDHKAIADILNAALPAIPEPPNEGGHEGVIFQ